MGPPVPDVEIAASPLTEPFFFVFGKMGMTKDDNFKPLHELPMSEGLESLRWMRRLSHVILLIAHAAEPLGNWAGELRAYPLHETIGPLVLQHSSKNSILPLFGIGQIPMGNERFLALQPFLTPVGMNVHLHLKLF